MVAITRSQPLDRLQTALARVVADDPSLGQASALMLHPIRLLEAIAVDVERVLRDDDDAAIQRTNLLLSNSVSAAPELAKTELAKTELAKTLDDSEVPPAELKLCPGGSLLDLGGLVLVGLAASRVGSRVSGSNVSRSYVRAVINLALATMPAESLAESLAEGLSDSQLAAILAGVCCRPGDPPTSIVPQLFNLCSRARYQALMAILHELDHQVEGPNIDELKNTRPWDTTFCDHIHRVERSPNDINELKIVLRVADGDTDGDAKAINAATNALIDALVKGEASLVFRTREGKAVQLKRSKIKHTEPEHDLLYVEPPDHAVPGWLGIATQTSKRAAHEYRKELRERWRTLNRAPFLAASPADVEVIALPKSKKALMPPRSPVASWSMIIGVRASQDGRSELRSRVDTILEVDFHATDAATFRVELDDEGPAIDLTVSEGVARGVIPGSRVSGSLDVRVTMSVTDAPDHVVSESFAVASPHLGVVIWRPVFIVDKQIHRVSIDEAEAAFSAAQEEVGSGLEQLELPWTATNGLVVAGEPDDHSPAALERVRAAAGRLAGRTDGLEGSILVALVPGKDEVAHWKGAEAARAVAVATPSGLTKVMQELVDAVEGDEQAPVRARASRLRLIGHLSGAGLEILEPTRVTERPAGPGAPHESRLVAVFYDRDGAEIGSGDRRERIKTQQRNGLGDFVALLELPQACGRVELLLEYAASRTAVAPRSPTLGLSRRVTSVLNAKLGSRFGPVMPKPLPRDRRVAVFTRSKPALVLSITNPDPKELGWNLVHRYGRPITLEIEVGRDDIWSRVLRDPSGSSASIDLDERPVGPGPTHLRLVASDGWNVEVETVELGAIGPGQPALVRKIGATLFVDGSPSVLGAKLEFVSKTDASFAKVTNFNEVLTLSKFDRKDLVLKLPSVL